MEDPFLNYLALGILLSVVIILVYGIIAIHDIPAQIAKRRHHPHEDAIHAAGWISLAMLHVLWPFLWIWAMMYRPDRGWGFGQKPGEPSSPAQAIAELEELKRRVTQMENRLEHEPRLAQIAEREIGPPAPDRPGPAPEQDDGRAAGAQTAQGRTAQR
ncbi:DUF3302 domain-containing protein [Bradyrhizobium sp. NAS80.1]|uniref:DUF3302 domain-containing protein n=1 Tax=Bradyrhizobium sp. NAS80.1 TaxID=1680159 RepID=UPI000A01CEEF